MQIVLISGLSGAGKSTALKILEDNGYFCVDNLPISMLEQLIIIYRNFGYSKIAIGVATHTSKLLDDLPQSIKLLQSNQIDVRILYLDARDDALIMRFSETRRRHPLSSGNLTIADCIRLERDLLADISIIAHRIDTSNLSANNLRALIKEFVGADYSQLNIIVQSFGFKYGVPIDCDFLFDVRCLPNPYYDKSIREFSGNDEPIIKFLAKEPLVKKMTDDIYTMISGWLDQFSRDNRNYLTIAIGCTGGKHRSVYIAEQLADILTANTPYKIIKRHRQIAR